MTEEEIRKWLDENNTALISEIEKSVPVKFTYWGEDHFACILHKNEKGEHVGAEIFYKMPLSQAKIAHELLHAKVALTLGDNSIMYNIDNKHALLSFMLKEEFASNILNVCEHVIFFQDYLDMGFDEAECFECASDLNKSLLELDNLKKNGLKENGHYSSERVFKYLVLAFSFMFYPNTELFKREVKILRKLDLSLFSRLSDLRRACDDLVICPENKEFIQDAYYKFASNMNKWFINAFKEQFLREYNIN